MSNNTCNDNCVSAFQRFVLNEFSPDHIRSTRKSEFFPSLVLGDNLFELKVIDLPPVSHFPATPEVEWSHFRFSGLRAAAAYILVYDANIPGSFQFIKTLREQVSNFL